MYTNDLLDADELTLMLQLEQMIFNDQSKPSEDDQPKPKDDDTHVVKSFSFKYSFVAYL